MVRAWACEADPPCLFRVPLDNTALVAERLIGLSHSLPTMSWNVSELHLDKGISIVFSTNPNIDGVFLLRALAVGFGAMATAALAYAFRWPWF